MLRRTLHILKCTLVSSMNLPTDQFWKHKNNLLRCNSGLGDCLGDETADTGLRSVSKSSADGTPVRSVCPIKVVATYVVAFEASRTSRTMWLIQGTVHGSGAWFEIKNWQRNAMSPGYILCSLLLVCLQTSSFLFLWWNQQERGYFPVWEHFELMSHKVCTFLSGPAISCLFRGINGALTYTK